MEFLTSGEFKRIAAPGVTSVQIIAPHNAPAARLSITRIAVEPGCTQDRHHHPANEQIWLALSGSGLLLLGDGATKPIAAGDAVRFADGDVHGITNTGSVPFVYLSITAPPLNLRPADYIAAAKRPGA